MKKLFSLIWNLQTRYYPKLDFKKVGQNIGGKWLIHATKHRRVLVCNNPCIRCRFSADKHDNPFFCFVELCHDVVAMNSD